MAQIITVLQVIVPLFAAIALGRLAKQKQLLKQEEASGLQRFVLQFGLPCVLFRSCLTANIGGESVFTMALLFPLIFLSTLLGFWLRTRIFPYHNLPLMFSAKESGGLGIPLVIILFGADQAYRMGVLDTAQALIAIPVLSILTVRGGDHPSVGQITKKVFTSPLLLMSLLGLALNLSGGGTWLDQVGVLGIILETTDFLGQGVSSLMIFCVGYNASFEKRVRKQIFRLSTVLFLLFGAFCLIIQGALFLLPQVDATTRWVMLLYCTLPPSFVSPGIGRTQEDGAIASGVCSVLTVVNLAIFCAVAMVLA